MKLDISSVSGLALNYAVAVARGWRIEPNCSPKGGEDFSGTLVMIKDGAATRWFDAYDLSGEFESILIQEKIDLKRTPYGWTAFHGPWRGTLRGESFFSQQDDSPSVAVARCFLASKYGDFVEVPDALVEQEANVHRPELKNSPRPRAA